MKTTDTSTKKDCNRGATFEGTQPSSKFSHIGQFTLELFAIECFPHHSPTPPLLASLMLYTKILPQSFLSSGERGFEVFLPYMGMAAILFSSAKPFDQIVITTSREAPM